MAKKIERTWERRLSGKPDELMLQFVQSLSIDRRLFAHDIAGSIAHARMLASQEIITHAEFKAIEKGLLEIRDQIAAGLFQFDPSHEDIHMAIENALTASIGEPGKKLHTGRSRNDQIATDLRLWMRDQIGLLQARITCLQQALVTMADRYVSKVMPAYTHLQRAQPISIAAYLLSFVEALDRDFIRLGNSLDLLNISPLGSGAIAGSTLRIDRRQTAKDLGFSGVSPNSIDSVGDRDFCAEFLFDCSMVSIHLSRLAEDWIIYSSSEFGFVRIEDAFCTSSSMMPQKRNPDALELIRGKTGGVFGALIGMLTILKGLPSGYNRDLQEDKVHVFMAMDTVLACLDMATAVVSHAQFNADRIAQGLDRGFLDATALAEYLVRKGVPFRQAHGVVGALVALAEGRDLRLCDLPLDQLTAACDRIDQDVYAVLSPDKVARRYVTEGAGGVTGASRSLASWKRRLKRR